MVMFCWTVYENGQTLHTHWEGFGSLLDDKAFDDMSQDLGLDNGLGRFVLSVVWRGARHGGRLVLIS